MQSNKTSKKTRKIAEENSSIVPGSGAGDAQSTPRTSRSSQSKVDNNETGSARHRKASSPLATETFGSDNATKAKTFTASAGATSTASTVAADLVAASSPTSGEIAFPASVTHEEIATLAHHYWTARGSALGSADNDWLRAEQELKAKRSSN